MTFMIFVLFFYNSYEVTICTNVFSPYDQLRKMEMKLLKGVVFFQNIVQTMKVVHVLARLYTILSVWK